MLPSPVPHLNYPSPLSSKRETKGRKIRQKKLSQEESKTESYTFRQTITQASKQTKQTNTIKTITTTTSTTTTTATTTAATTAAVPTVTTTTIII